MLADSATDRTVLVKITGDTESGRRCTLIRASSELGVHRPADDGSVDGADAEEDRHTPLQVTVVFVVLLAGPGMLTL